MHADISFSGNRKKLWQLDNGYHCPIIGTCLSMYDLKKVAKQLNLNIPNDSADYAIHGYFVGEAKEHGLVSRKLQKLLDRKYQLAVSQFSRASSSDEVDKMWREAHESGDIPGPFWAVMTHPDASDEVCTRAYGQVHMLSHLTGAANRADIKTLRLFQDQNASLNETIDQIRGELREKSDTAERLKREIALKNDTIQSLFNSLEKANRTIEHLSGVREAEARCKALEQKLAKSIHHNQSLRERLERVRTRNSDLAESNAYLKSRAMSLEIEQDALEHDLIELLTDQNLCGCPEKRRDENGLCGRAILYVGGRSNLVQHYRKMVEHQGGVFLYHDGGLQDSPHRLPDLLLQADAVCCPLDCVSHDATMRIKRNCKQTRIKQHLLRSSGLSSFAKALRELTTTHTIKTISND